MAGKQVTELDALPSFTDDSLLPVHNGAGLKKGLLSQLSNYLGTKFSNPNLLINPDFRINQRRQNTYSSTGAGATVERVGTDENPVLNFGIPKGKNIELTVENGILSINII